jgi:glycosyltransferase involved in cell wall biosynthesis
MKIVHALARYFPDKCGGIQVNLSELIPQLQSQGLEIKIAAAQSGAETKDLYKLDNLEVYRYPIHPQPKSQLNQGHKSHGKFESFVEWLESQKADIYHQHHWEVTCGFPHLRLAKQIGMKTVVTIHYPIPICQRSTLMLNGTTACDGKIDIVRCSRCTDNLTKNLPDFFVETFSKIPLKILEQIPLPVSAYLPFSDEQAMGKFIRPFVVPTFVAARQNSLKEMAKYADTIIVVCDWLKQALVANGIQEEKIVLCRYGISYALQADNKKTSIKLTNNLKVAFLGRWDVSKGIEIIVKAIRNLPVEINIKLVIHGISQDEKYRQRIMQLINNDARISVGKELTREELPSVLSNYDLLAVPSQWLETGPLVVLESHSVGVPVIGSNLGGIAELVKHGIDGWLVAANDIQAWTEAFTKLASDADLLDSLRKGIKPIRTIKQQAEETIKIYNNIH